jgi:hypothetical protein
MRRSWVPSKDHTNTGRLCSIGSGRHPVPRRRSSYAALRLPHFRQPRLRSSLAFGLPRRGRLFCAARGGRQRVRPANTLRVGDLSSALRRPVSSRGEVRASQVSGPSSSSVPWSKTPPGAVHCSPMAQRPPWPSGCMKPWAPGMPSFRGCISHGPHARVPTHRRTRYRLRRKARYRPGWADP